MKPKKYYVKLVRYVIMDIREVEANNKEEAKEKALPTFYDINLDEYDDIWVEQMEED